MATPASRVVVRGHRPAVVGTESAVPSFTGMQGGAGPVWRLTAPRPLQSPATTIKSASHPSVEAEPRLVQEGSSKVKVAKAFPGYNKAEASRYG